MSIAKLDYPKADIKMHVSTPIEEAFRIKACSKEPWTVEWIESMPAGSVLYDVGANVGSYTLLAAALGHTVVAIEPGFANFARLCANVLLNDLGPRVIPLCLAAGNAWLGTPVMEQSLYPGFAGGEFRLRVPCLPLDSLPAVFGVPIPTHIKIDVDGCELAVLEGNAGILAKSLMVEIGLTRNQAEPRLGLYSHEHVQADPLDGAPAESHKAVALLSQHGYTLKQHWASMGNHPLAWYGRWERNAVD